ncbi:hypothetical protein J7M22_00940 [Candidatus Poribacteria bacterium]|nr:hypothetical protein [Candidatus Poribacteria bacterium]
MRGSRFWLISITLIAIAGLAVWYLPPRLDSLILSEEEMMKLGGGSQTEYNAKCVDVYGCEHTSGCENQPDGTSIYYNNIRWWKKCTSYNGYKCTINDQQLEHVCTKIYYSQTGCTGNVTKTDTWNRPIYCQTTKLP